MFVYIFILNNKSIPKILNKTNVFSESNKKVINTLVHVPINENINNRNSDHKWVSFVNNC